MSLEPEMTASFARARARGLELGLTTPVPWENRGGTAPGNGDLCATKFHRVLGYVGRGTGLDRGEREPSLAGGSIMERDQWRYLLWLSAFPCCFRVFGQDIVWGSQPQSRWDFFRVGSSIQFHSVPLTTTYLTHATRGKALVRHGGGTSTTNLTNITNEGRERR